MSETTFETLPSDRVSDAPSNNFVYRVLPRRLWPYAQLARWDRPIGWQLLLWPCLWSAALAANVPGVLETGYGFGALVWHSILFTIGAIAMRGAGCTYNDLVDHRIDEKVARTRSRPLPSGRVSRLQAKLFIVAQALTGLVVLLQFNGFAILLGMVSLLFVAIYPFAKRFTDWPQFFLGLAFSWGALMGWAVAFGGLSIAPVVLYLGAIAWTIGYDTIYAHQDKEDDAVVGVRSTALLFGERTKQWLVVIYGAAVALFFLAFLLAGAAWPAYLALAAASAHFARQVMVLDIDNADQCLALFKSNSTAGLILFAGLLLGALVNAITALPPVY
jgi:4-hydroxybenzoate polyprenyltransferase